MFKHEEVIHRGMSHAARQVHYFAWLESTKNFAERKLWIQRRIIEYVETALQLSENRRLLSARGMFRALNFRSAIKCLAGDLSVQHSKDVVTCLPVGLLCT